MEEPITKTTFYSDFTIADKFWNEAIKDTFKRCHEWRKDNIEYYTELVIALNGKIFEWYGKNDERARLYNDLWEKADAYACENFKWDDLDYYYRVTD